MLEVVWRGGWQRCKHVLIARRRAARVANLCWDHDGMCWAGLAARVASVAMQWRGIGVAARVVDGDVGHCTGQRYWSGVAILTALAQ